jgi:tetratricopeptide (TPR) repeat protein
VKAKPPIMTKFYPLLFLFFTVTIALSQKNKNTSSAQTYIEHGEAEWEVSNYKDAITWFNKAIKLDSTRAEAYYKRAKSFVQIQHFAEAEKDLKTADSLGFTDTEMPFYYGVAYFGLKQYEKALAYLEKALAQNFENDAFFIYLAETYKYLNKPKLALQFYEKALAKAETDQKNEIYFLRANFFYEKEEWNKAHSDLDSILATNPRFWKAYKLKAEIYFRQENDKECIHYLSQYFQRIPDKKKISPYEYSLMAWCYANLKEFAKALEAITKAIALDKDNPELYSERANYYIQQKNYAKALQDTEKAIELDGFDLTYFRQRAFLYYNLKQYEQALSDYIFLAQQDETDAENHYKVAELKFLLGKPSQEFQNDVLTAYQLGYPKEKMLAELRPYTEKKLSRKRSRRKQKS